MADTRRGKKQNYNKNWVARKEWMTAKKLGRRKQIWVWDIPPILEGTLADDGQIPVGHWEKL